MTAVLVETPDRIGDERPEAAAPRRRAAVLVVGLLAAAGALWATVAAEVAFPYLGVNHDEAVYLLQADSLRSGRLFPPAPADPEIGRSMLPWLSTQRGEVYVPKYSPAWPAVLAVARAATGSYHAAQAVVAAGTVVVTYLLAFELVRRRTAAVVAAAVFVLSPFFLLQAPTFLAYLPNVLVLELFALAFARGTRTGSRVLLGLSGLALGVAFFTRPFDALLFGLPFGIWLVASRRRMLRRLASDVGALALGAAPGLVATLVFFQAATGSPLRSPFFVDEKDTIGFGARRMLPDDPLTQYGAPEALQGFRSNVVLLSFWCFGGLILMALAVVALRRRVSPLEPWLALVAVTVPIGYALFWGSYIATNWEGPWRNGPYYYLPVLIPLSVLGAKGFISFWRWDRLLAGLTVLGMFAVSASVAVRALDHQLDRTADLRRRFAPLEAVAPEPAVIFLPSAHLLNPFTQARNVSFDQQVLWARDRGTVPNLAVLDAFSGRTPYRFEGGPNPELRRLVPLRDEQLRLRVVTDHLDAASGLVELAWQGERYRVPLSELGEADVVLSAVAVEGIAPRPAEESDGGDDEEDLVVRLLVSGQETATDTTPIRVNGTTLSALVPTSPRSKAEALDVIVGTLLAP